MSRFGTTTLLFSICVVSAGAAAMSIGAETDSGAATQEICLNGDAWTFQPLGLPFFGYELDAPGRWKQPRISHAFIVEAISDPANDWETKHPVRVPMSWSSALSEPGSREATGDFAFPWFWQYVHKGVYERTFSVPEAFRGQRIKLWFESVNFRCWIYVNDRLVDGTDNGESTHENKLPFEVDVTDYVSAPSTGNRLRVVVQDFTASFEGAFPNEDHPLTGITYPLGDRTDYYSKDRGWRNLDSGIVGDVMLRTVPLVNVKDAFVRTSVKDSAIEAAVVVRNESPETKTVRLRARVTEWKNGQTALEIADAPVLTLQPGERRSVSLRQHWSEPRLWWPHDPFLYVLTVELEEGSRRVASHDERFGFREVEMISSEDDDRRGFYLNGVRVRLFGESVEPTWKDGYSEGVGTSGLYLYNPEYWSAMIEEAKRLNMTVLRPHRGMAIKRMFEIADETGMMMIAESTISDGNHGGAIGTVANQRRAIRDMIANLRNHPSIVIWSLANEAPYNEEWADEARLHDATRPYVATQTEPRNHPSPSLAAATGSYAMGLSGYEPNIYHRHDGNWDRKPMYVYEDNACYDEPTDAERLATVQKGLTIFRGHRSSGYEIICTFYTWQKVYGQPVAPAGKLRAIEWRADETASRGYRPDFARMPLLDAWSERPAARIIRPLSVGEDPADAFWQRSFSPVAVFDRGYDERLDIETNPYVAPLDARRVLTIHNDDLVDRSTSIEVTWSVATFDGSEEISRGTSIVAVPLGGVWEKALELDLRGHDAVRVTYCASKSGQERFRETIYLRGEAPEKSPTANEFEQSGESLVVHAIGADTQSKGYVATVYGGAIAPQVLFAQEIGPATFVQFNPKIETSGIYDVFVHVVPGQRGTLSVEVLHDTTNTTTTLDLSKPGWIRLAAGPFQMKAGALQNAVKLGSNGTAKRAIVDAVKLVRIE